MGPAKPYGIGQDVSDILEALRARFRLTARDACVQLQGFRRNSQSTLKEHATMVERLESGTKCFPPVYQQPSLEQHLLVAEVETIE